ncbi:FAD:protein FMN transferase [Denitrificimonas caeni]|uniref:FAD:protein FMN transferase n=1 Tax=Denitrificimonas caeni TaxID=521720 RepID=UPI0019666EB9|nr:FAD:protein FMN transferase [Denitrificimonas caeni]
MLRNLLQGACLVSTLVLALSGCESNSERVEVLSGPTMGSTFTIKYVYNATTPAADAVGVEVQSILDQVDRQMSTYRLDSDIARFNQSPAQTCMPMPQPVLDLAQYGFELSQLSDGAFDLTLGPLLNLWGFGPQARSKHVPSAEAIAEAKARVGYQHVRVVDGQLCKDADVKIEFNSIAAGYTVDRISERFAELNIDSYMIEVTGELIAKGRKPDGTPWRIAMEQPLGDGQRVIQRVLEIDGYGVNTSGDYRNYFEENGIRFSHTIDPQAGAPISHRLASVTVVDRSTLHADGLGTLLLVLGPERGLSFAEEHDIAAFFVMRDGEGFATQVSSEFSRMFPEGGNP